MSRSRTSRQVRLGIAGLGCLWEQEFRPAVRALERRLRIQAVFDPVPARCESVAAEFNCAVVPGLAALVTRGDLDGVIAVEPPGSPVAVAELLSLAQTPVLVSSAMQYHSPTRSVITGEGTVEGTLLIPYTPWRYSSVTLLLRELMATGLGRPEEIWLRPALRAAGSVVDLPSQMALLDWCLALTRSVRIVPLQDGRLGLTAGPLGQPVTAVGWHGGHGVEVESIAVRFSSGTVQLNSPLRAEAWLQRDGNELLVTKDRSPAEIMLDHFCRRLVGGLIPLPLWSDLQTAKSWSLRLFDPE